MKIRVYIFEFLVLLVIWVASVHAEAPQFKIGAILPLTGPMALAGTEVRDAINLAISELDRRRYQYTVLFEDNGSGPTATAAATNKLVKRDRVQTLITLWPEAANIAAPITERQKVLHYTIAWDPEIACASKLVLSHQAMVNDYARKTLELLRSHHIKAIFFFHDSVFQQGATILSQLSTEYGIHIRKIFSFDRGKTDFRSELVSAQQSGLEGILIWSIMPETEIFLKQLRELRLARFVTGFFDVVQDLSLIEGYRFASEVHSTTQFQRKFQARFGRAAIMKGPNAYDIIHLLASAVEQVPGQMPSAAAIKEKLTTVTDFSGAVGAVSIDKCGNSSYPIALKIVKEGNLVTLAD